MVQEQNEIIGRRLQDVRESAHMDFYDMAKLLRVSVGHYRKIERGVYGLDVEKLVILYEKLDVDPLYLLAGRRQDGNQWIHILRYETAGCVNCSNTASSS